MKIRFYAGKLKKESIRIIREARLTAIHLQIMDKIAIVGSCSIDFCVYTPRIPQPGETLKGTKFTTTYGGKGANQCVAATKLGVKTYMVGRVGSDSWGEKYKENLVNTGVNVTFLNITPNTVTGIAQICVGEGGENQIVIVPGANDSLSKRDIQTAGGLLETADVVVGQLETPFHVTLEAFKLAKGVTVLNAAPASKNIDEIKPYVSILCVNETEAAYMTDIDVVDLSNNTNAALKKLVESGWESVIITLGGKGAVYWGKFDEHPIHVECPRVTPVDCTGAGDAFVGALATFLLTKKGTPMHQIIGAACEVATVSVTKAGTQTSYPTGIEQFEKEYKYKVTPFE